VKVEDRLRDLPAPGEGSARRRAWELAAAELAERPPRRRRRLPGVAAAAGAVVLAVAVITPPGSAVADWVEERVRAVVDDKPAPPPRPAALERLPGGGRILVLAGERRELAGAGVPPTSAPWIAGDAGRRRLLGAVNEATWSPRGRFVAATRGAALVAVDLRGRRRWSVIAPATVRAPSWSPDGFRVAYVTGGTLRVVAGDGRDDRLITGPLDARGAPMADDASGNPTAGGANSAAGSAGGLDGGARNGSSAAPDTLPTARVSGVLAVAPAWRPGRRHVLAFARRDRVVLLDADTGHVLWRRAHDGPPTGLAFSPSGDRLLVTGPSALRILDGRDGRLLREIRAPDTFVFQHAVWSRGGRELAVVRRGGPVEPREELVRLSVETGDAGPLAFTARDLGPPLYSPDGRWLMVDWRDTDSWLFLSLDGGRPRLVSGAAERFGGGSATPAGWCCPP
jgi:hypothetical protein